MATVAACIEQLRLQLETHKKRGLKEYPTRVIFVDPMLEALGWDVRDTREVQLEYTTIDGRSVDYALKINNEPALFLEAKPISDPLDDVKSITQVVSYAANAGIDWCILTNGVTYKVYRSTERAAAPEKLLYEVSIDPKQTQGMSIKQVATLFSRFSRDAIAQGMLDDIGEQIFVTAKVRKALDKVFMEPPTSLTRLIRRTMGDDSIKPSQIRAALKRIWTQQPELPIAATPRRDLKTPTRKRKEYAESHHTQGKPQEVVELFRTIDTYCLQLDPAQVQRQYLAKYVKYMHGKNIFSSVHLQQSGLRVWLKLDYSDLAIPPTYARDVSNVGHWGVGDVELAIDSLARLSDAKPLIRQSFEKSASVSRRVMG
jgi:predicted transport protein